MPGVVSVDPDVPLDLYHPRITQKGSPHPSSGGGGNSSNATFDDQSYIWTSGAQTFTMAHTPISNSLGVFRNGVKLRNGVDYTVLATVITVVVTLDTGDWINASYAY